MNSAIIWYHINHANCETIIYTMINNNDERAFYCHNCATLILWISNIVFRFTKNSIKNIENLLTLFINDYRKSKSHNLFDWNFINKKLNKKTIAQYLEIFNHILYQHVYYIMNSKILESSKVIDGTFLYKLKRTHAAHPSYATRHQWFFRMRESRTPKDL